MGPKPDRKRSENVRFRRRMPAGAKPPSEEDRKRWAEADAEDERAGWGDARRRIQTAFAER